MAIILHLEAYSLFLENLGPMLYSVTYENVEKFCYKCWLVCIQLGNDFWFWQSLVSERGVSSKYQYGGS